MSALMKANGNLSQTARLLKINRGKLRYRLDKLEINPQDLVDFKTEVYNTIYN